MRTERELEALIRSHSYMVRSAARAFGGRLAEDPDLIQCGMIGLWRAAREWDGERDFHPMAKVCIRHAMVDHLRKIRNWEEPVDLTGEGEGLAGCRCDTPDEGDITRAICRTFPAGSRERAVLRGLLVGESKESLARRWATNRKQVAALARRAWKEVDL